ncbi:MAG: hypothetical protein P8Y54_07450 [Xanthomonadales bacterium]
MFEKLKRRKVDRVAAGYAAAATRGLPFAGGIHDDLRTQAPNIHGLSMTLQPRRDRVRAWSTSRFHEGVRSQPMDRAGGRAE